MIMPWGGKSKVENDLMGVENARGAEFEKMHSPPFSLARRVTPSEVFRPATEIMVKENLLLGQTEKVTN